MTSGQQVATDESLAMPRPTQNDSKPLLLVIDDDQEAREMVQLLLEGAGYRCALAANGAQALSCLRQEVPPLLILLDLHMPVMSGRAFIATVRPHPVFGQIPIIVLTGNHDTSGLKQPPVVAVLKKPVADVEGLLHLVKAQVAQAQARGRR